MASRFRSAQLQLDARDCINSGSFAILERVQKRLDDDPSKIPLRSKAVEHPFGTIKAWMGATHFKMKTLKHVATEIALHVLAYNMTRVMAVLGVPELVKAMRT